KFTVAAGKLPRVGARRHQRILIPLKVQNLHSGPRPGSKGLGRGEFTCASGGVLKCQAIIESLRRAREDGGQGRIGAEVSRRTHSRDPVDARWVAKRPTICDQAAMAVR